jgi:hypothetical protein
MGWIGGIGSLNQIGGLSSLDAARDDSELCRRVVAQAFPPSLRFGVARRSAKRGGGRPAVGRAQAALGCATDFLPILPVLPVEVSV